MNIQDILEEITRHRADPMMLHQPSLDVNPNEVQRKFEEIEWALQALAEYLRDSISNRS